MARKGLLIVLSGPSGVGKGTVRAAILQKTVKNSCTLYPQRLVSQDQVKWMEKIISSNQEKILKR